MLVCLPLVALNSSTFKLQEASEFRNLETASLLRWAGKGKEISVRGSRKQEIPAFLHLLLLLTPIPPACGGEGKAPCCVRTWEPRGYSSHRDL